jgi:serine/threonine protein kinase
MEGPLCFHHSWPWFHYAHVPRSGSAPLFQSLSLHVRLLLLVQIGADVASALAYLHPNVVHRDVKPANVLIRCESLPLSAWRDRPTWRDLLLAAASPELALCAAACGVACEHECERLDSAKQE